MRHAAGPLNRTWLIIIGILLLAGGAIWFLLATGAAASLAGMASGNNQVVTPGIAEAMTTAGAAVGLVAVDVVLVILGLAWIIAQIPRKNPAKPYRLQNESSDGMSSCSPTVLAHAVENHVTQLPGVSKASSVVRGASTAPELALRVTAEERSDIADIVSRIRGEVAGDFTRARESRAGRDIPITTSNEHFTLSQTEGSVRALIRDAEDTVDGVLIGHCGFDGDVTDPAAHIVVNVSVSILVGAVIPDLAGELRGRIVSTLASQTTLTLDAVNLSFDDVYVDPATADPREA